MHRERFGNFPKTTLWADAGGQSNQASSQPAESPWLLRACSGEQLEVIHLPPRLSRNIFIFKTFYDLTILKCLFPTGIKRKPSFPSWPTSFPPEVSPRPHGDGGFGSPLLCPHKLQWLSEPLGWCPVLLLTSNCSELWEQIDLVVCDVKEMWLLQNMESSRMWGSGIGKGLPFPCAGAPFLLKSPFSWYVSAIYLLC